MAVLGGVRYLRGLGLSSACGSRMETDRKHDYHGEEDGAAANRYRDGRRRQRRSPVQGRCVAGLAHRPGALTPSAAVTDSDLLISRRH